MRAVPFDLETHRIQYMLKSKIMSLRTAWLKLKTWMGAKPVWQIKEGVVIEPVFIAGGVQYYRIKDQFNTFTLRGMAAIEVYDKWNMRMDRTTANKYADELLALFTTSGRIDLGEAVSLIKGMKERLNWVIAPKEYLWDMFCVSYFDASESPYSYDENYQYEKKRRLKAAGGIDDFFLYTRLSELMPMPKLSANDLALAFQVIQQLERQSSQILYNGKQRGKQNEALSPEPNLNDTTQKT